MSHLNKKFAKIFPIRIGQRVQRAEDSFPVRTISQASNCPQRCTGTHTMERRPLARWAHQAGRGLGRRGAVGLRAQGQQRGGGGEAEGRAGGGAGGGAEGRVAGLGGGVGPGGGLGVEGGEGGGVADAVGAGAAAAGGWLPPWCAATG